MKEMSDLEMQLGGWAPRRPSARLEQKLFARPEARRHDGKPEACPAFRLGWLAPITAGLVAACMLVAQRNSPEVSGSDGSGPMMAMILSNQSAAAYLPGSFSSEQNRPLMETFEWTNREISTSSIASLSGSRGTN